MVIGGHHALGESHGAALSAVVPKGPVLYKTRQRASAERPGRTIAVRLADNDGERNSASMVVNRRYACRGYGSDHALPVGSHAVTFTASSTTDVFGTITLTVDTDAGLAVDRTFERELQELRGREGMKLCELTKFAFDPSPDSRPFLASLFHVVFLYGTERYGCTDLLIEVNPRHVRFYEVMLGFKRIGALKSNSSVSAPSQLLHLKVAEIGENIDRFAGNLQAVGRSLYPYFFSKREEAGLRARVSRFARTPVEILTPEMPFERIGSTMPAAPETTENLSKHTERRAAA